MTRRTAKKIVTQAQRNGVSGHAFDVAMAKAKPLMARYGFGSKWDGGAAGQRDTRRWMVRQMGRRGRYRGTFQRWQMTARDWLALAGRWP